MKKITEETALYGLIDGVNPYRLKFIQDTPFFIDKKYAMYYAIKKYMDDHEYGDFSYPIPYKIIEIKVPFVGRNVFGLHLYNGFLDYTDCNILTVQSYSKNIYSCRDHLYEDEIWKLAKKAADKNPKDFIITDDMIASKDCLGKPFEYGDIIEGKFNLRIVKFNVIRTKAGGWENQRIGRFIKQYGCIEFKRLEDF